MPLDTKPQQKHSLSSPLCNVSEHSGHTVQHSPFHEILQRLFTGKGLHVEMSPCLFSRLNLKDQLCWAGQHQSMNSDESEVWILKAIYFSNNQNHRFRLQLNVLYISEPKLPLLSFSHLQNYILIYIFISCVLLVRVWSCCSCFHSDYYVYETPLE